MLEFGLLQTSDGHQFLLPRPRIRHGRDVDYDH